MTLEEEYKCIKRMTELKINSKTETIWRRMIWFTNGNDIKIYLNESKTIKNCC